VLADGEPAPAVHSGPIRTLSFCVATLRNMTCISNFHEPVMQSGLVEVLLSMLEPSKKQQRRK